MRSVFAAAIAKSAPSSEVAIRVGEKPPPRISPTPKGRFCAEKLSEK